MSEVRVESGSVQGIPVSIDGMPEDTYEAPIVDVYETQGTPSEESQTELHRVHLILRMPWSKSDREEDCRVIRLTLAEKDNGRWVPKGRKGKAGKFLKALSECKTPGGKRGVGIEKWSDLKGAVFLWTDREFDFGKDKESGNRITSTISIPVEFLGDIESWEKAKKEAKAKK